MMLGLAEAQVVVITRAPAGESHVQPPVGLSCQGILLEDSHLWVEGLSLKETEEISMPRELVAAAFYEPDSDGDQETSIWYGTFSHSLFLSSPLLSATLKCLWVHSYSDSAEQMGCRMQAVTLEPGLRGRPRVWQLLAQTHSQLSCFGAPVPGAPNSRDARALFPGFPSWCVGVFCQLPWVRPLYSFQRILLHFVSSFDL